MSESDPATPALQASDADRERVAEWPRTHEELVPLTADRKALRERHRLERHGRR